MITEAEVKTKIINSLKIFATHEVVTEIKQITPDASLRRYFRVYFKAGKSILAMHFDSLNCPEASGDCKVTADIAFCELGHFFKKNGLNVPEIYFTDLPNSLILLEDLGDKQLFSVIQDQDKIKTEYFLKQAINQILILQNIAFDSNFFPFQRSFTAKEYYKEMQEIIDYSLINFPPAKEELVNLNFFFQKLAEELEQQEQCLAHRDFHAWNLLVVEDQVKVIDFQDALLATKTYDLVSLLNDRDMDSLLGEDLYKKLLFYFQLNSKHEKEIFFEQYDKVLLQRDLKVAGRFLKLANSRGLSAYLQWVPGTLRRIGSTMERMLATAQEKTALCLALEKAFLIFKQYYPEVKQGAERKLRFK